MSPYAAGVEARNDVTVAIRNWFSNRNPLVTRLPYVPVERVDYIMYSHRYRPRSLTLATTAITSNATTSITVSDNTFLMAHDVLAWLDHNTGVEERIQITATDPNADGTTIVVTRGVSGTTKATAVSVGDNIDLIGNSRTGGEVNQTALTTVGVPRTNYCQTFQFPVQVSGGAQSTRAQVLPGGIQTPFDFNQTMQLQQMVDDMEVALYYGIADHPTSSTDTVTPKMNGLKSILVSNNVTAPSDAGAYTPDSLIRDTLQACRSNGGEPDLLLVSTNFMSGLAKWGQAVQRVPAGETEYGTPLSVLHAPFLNGVSILEAPLLKPGTAIALTSGEVYIRNKRNPFWMERGRRGDMYEGDWIAEIGLEVVNEQHHAWVSGITAFSAN